MKKLWAAGLAAFLGLSGCANPLFILVVGEKPVIHDFDVSLSWMQDWAGDDPKAKREVYNELIPSPGAPLTAARMILFSDSFFYSDSEAAPPEARFVDLGGGTYIDLMGGVWKYTEGASTASFVLYCRLPDVAEFTADEAAPAADEGTTDPGEDGDDGDDDTETGPPNETDNTGDGDTETGPPSETDEPDDGSTETEAPEERTVAYSVSWDNGENWDDWQTAFTSDSNWQFNPSEESETKGDYVFKLLIPFAVKGDPWTLKPASTDETGQSPRIVQIELGLFTGTIDSLGDKPLKHRIVAIDLSQISILR